MFDANVLFKANEAARIANLTDNQLTHLGQSKNVNLDSILPDRPGRGGVLRMAGPVRVGMLCIVSDLMASEVKAPLAGKIARRVMEAHQARPEVEQWVIVATANGNVSTLPYGQTDLRTGFVSGAALKFALVVDLRTYADRVAAAIADAPKVIGGDDER